MNRTTPYQSLVLAGIWAIIAMLRILVFGQNKSEELDTETRRIMKWLYRGFRDKEVIGSTYDKVTGIYE